ncbi:MAG: hydrogenase iron-sulfur subunit [Desulfovibrio sp.]|nr:hydrogenase iron-sulfur subunit [Desulfovibrio sp.]
MSGLTQGERRELRIVGFLCNWCSYGGADTAGVARASQPTDLRIIRVPCSGRVDPLFVVKALLNGADGVLVSGCHPRDCHYGTGNFYARRRLEVLRRFLPVLGIDPKRFSYTWVSASEGQRWQTVVTRFTEEIHELGPAPRFMDAGPLEREIEQPASSPLHSLDSASLESLAALKQAIASRLPELDLVLGWQEGRDKAHLVPLFIRTPEDLDRLAIGPLAVHNLAVYLPELKGRKVGIVVKGCDGRSVVELLQEKLISREDVEIFAVACHGTFDTGRIDQALGRYQHLESVRMDGKELRITCDGRERHFSLENDSSTKCLHCKTPLSPLSDHSFGSAPSVGEGDSTPPDLARLDAMTLDERRAFWRSQMERCIRCYACRNACPLCVCRDHCISDTREPHFTTQESTAKEKFFFQIIHSLHLAGRCTGCGECQRSCPVGIPILALREHLIRVTDELFPEYRAGMTVDAAAPLLTYSVEEPHIQEREW